MELVAMLGHVGAVLVSVLALSSFSQGCELSDVVVTIITHSNQHVAMVAEKQERWLSNETGLTVLLSSQLETDGEAWTIAPLLLPLVSNHGNSSWFVFVTEWTQLNVRKLCTALAFYDKQTELFIGHQLEDVEPTVTHHYSGPGALAYPLLLSGFILSSPALARLATLVNNYNPSFNIDASYEFSQFLKYLHTPSFDELFPEPSPPPPHSLTLTHAPTLCHTHLAPHCATGYSLQRSCGSRVRLEKVFFAVKTCTEYHSKRLPVVQETWAADLSDLSIGYYSDSRDDRYGTIDIGVPNTERGHCGKLEAILRLFEHAHKDREWLVVTDDDTLLSMERLLELLSCYDHSQPLLLGELYGYSAHSDGGISFITGGGGMVLSGAAVRSFVISGRSCPGLDYPDDMFLGIMGRALGWSVVHSPLFHQSQPGSYPDILLSQQKAISFHRHSPMDPRTVYHQYLTDSGRGRERTEL